MSHQTHKVCIEACLACALACDHCASSCLREDNPASMADCIAVNMDCAQICRLAASFMSRDSVHSVAACALCADICERCWQTCNRHPEEHCQACAAACRRCADECRRRVAG